ncbi:helix-turn-helix transcriptional regulator [Flagellimonas hymeniacidonis]|uniref:Helix-turn-helix transcriptional regulator n=1 Tax=Flagellimonas hymeniacidonis TaxID=2603628 RepID=A0A5C8V332_9FLAO|nr:helix-turn-helix transcriptional regulator [Flagellimonas hymeniacidonis]TXN35731.1 helix-turn-helix transcriptional regulator [Flagellimonas hymeniacidonis]
MNQAFPDLIYNGVMLCISIQLLLIALFYFYKKQLRLIVLGVLCFLVGTMFINNLYWNVVKESLFLSILLGAGKNIFFGPLIYLYVSTAVIPLGKIKKHVLIHLTFPFIVHLIYLVLKFGFSSFYAQYYYWVVTSLGYIILPLNLFYLILGILMLKRNARKFLAPRVQKRYWYFVSIMLGYYTYSSLYNMLPYLTGSPFFGRNFLMLNRYVFMPLGLLINSYLLIFSITEFFKFKSLFAPSLLYKQEALNHEESSLIVQKLQQGFVEQRLYTKPNLSIDDLAKALDLGKGSLRHYFKQNNTSFKRYLNRTRVEKFKELLTNAEYQNYSLAGLSTLVGFQSNATFFRVFKELEGITPSEFQRSLNT